MDATTQRMGQRVAMTLRAIDATFVDEQALGADNGQVTSGSRLVLT